MHRPEVLRNAANHASAHSYRVWGFGEGPGILGLLAAGDLLGESAYFKRAEELVTPWLSKPLVLEEHVASAEVLLALEARTERHVFREAAKKWADLIVGAARDRPGRPGVHRPDLTSWSTEVWVDCRHTDSPGLAALGQTSEAVAVVEESAAVLQDPCELFCHGFDTASDQSNGVHWGRGCSWALLGLVGTLAEVHDASLHSRLLRLNDALARFENEGRWRTFVDDPTAPHEASVSALVAGGVYAGLRDGMLGEVHATLAERALDAALTETSNGALLVSDATPIWEPEDYKRRGHGVYTWGQGPLLLALAAAEGWKPTSTHSN